MQLSLKEYDVDDVLLEVGQLGRYQWNLFLYLNAQQVLGAVIALSVVFIGVEPSWGCETSTGTLSIVNDSVQRCVMYEEHSCTMVVDQPSATIVAEYDLYCSQFYKVALSQSLYFIGMLIGAWFLGPFADKIGRRKVYLYSLIAYVITTFISAASFSYVLFAFSRFVLGFTAAGVMITYFVLLMEIIGPDYRATMGIASMAFFSLGIMILPVFAYFVPNWKLLTGLLGVLGVVHLTMFRIIPESPRWLLLKGNADEAMQILKTLAQCNGKSLLPGVTLKKGEMAERSTASVLDLFSFPTILIRTTVTVSGWFSASFSYYGLSLGADSLSDNLYVSCALMGLVELPGLLVCVLAVDRYGRKMSLVSSLLLTGIACICSGAVQWTSQYMKSPIVGHGVTMVLSLTGKLAVCTAFALLYVYTSELFPTEVRNKGLGISSVAARVGGILAPFIALLDHWSLGLPLIVMGLVPLISGLLSLLLPETKGKSLPDTLHELKNMV